MYTTHRFLRRLRRICGGRAVQLPAARAEHHILEAEADSNRRTHVDRVAESRRSSAAPTTATAASLALEIGGRGVGRHNKRVADGDDIDAFAEGEDQPATAAVGRRKRPRRGRGPEDIVDGDGDEPACEAGHRPVRERTRPSRSARQTRRARRPASQTIERERLGEIGAMYTVRALDGTLLSDSRFISLFALAHKLPVTRRVTQTLPKRKIGQDIVGERTIC
jgi:hypothetical protein